MHKSIFRWGLIGPGRIAHRFAAGLVAIDDAELYAVASRSAERGNSFAAKYGIEKVYASYEALVQDPAIDAVYIATPHNFHYSNTMLCLEAGKPVLCEKPLTVNALESEKLVAAARAKSLFLMEGLWTRYLPIYQQVREWLEQDVIGDVRLLSSSFGFKIPRDNNDRNLNLAVAGGNLLDMGVYCVAISHWVYGKNPVEIDSFMHLGPTGVDELTVANLKYSETQLSQFSSNFLSTTVNDFFIYGTDGYIRIHPYFWDTTTATLNTWGTETTVTRPFRATGFEYETEEAMRCIRAGLLESPTMTHENTIANMRVMDDIRAQADFRYDFEMIE